MALCVIRASLAPDRARAPHYSVSFFSLLATSIALLPERKGGVCSKEWGTAGKQKVEGKGSGSWMRQSCSRSCWMCLFIRVDIIISVIAHWRVAGVSGAVMVIVVMRKR